MTAEILQWCLYYNWGLYLMQANNDEGAGAEVLWQSLQTYLGQNLSKFYILAIFFFPMFSQSVLEKKWYILVPHITAIQTQRAISHKGYQWREALWICSVWVNEQHLFQLLEEMFLCSSILGSWQRWGSQWASWPFLQVYWIKLNWKEN